MILTHKIALQPNNKQIMYFKKACGVARFSYNWALVEWKKQYSEGKKPNEAKLRKLLNSIKRAEFPWMLGVTKNAPQQAIKNLGEAYQRFFKKTSRYPKLKKKNKSRDSFRADPGTDPKQNPNAVKVEGKRVKLPIIGWIKMRESLRFEGKILSAIVSRTADRWFISLQVEIDHKTPIRENQTIGGCDLGSRNLATLDDGRKFQNPKSLVVNLKKLRMLQKSLHRKMTGSENRKKARVRLSRLYAGIANIRKDVLHKLTTLLAREFDVLGIEDLNVSEMMKNRKLSRAISDIGLYEFRRQLEYKQMIYGNKVIVADRWFPSSKLCSDCGFKLDELDLSIREWICPQCGVIHDRDVNAAQNLRNVAESSSVLACGEESSGMSNITHTKLSSVKQEFSVMVDNYE